MKSSKATAVRRVIIALHRDLGFFFAGIVIIYAVSGILMNHRDSINPNYSIEIREFVLDESFPADRAAITDDDIAGLAEKIGQGENMIKYYFSNGELKLLFKGGSHVDVNLSSRHVTYEHVSRRPLLSDMVRLHYNPGSWWSWFSDVFAVSLVIITVTGLFIIPGRNGIRGRGAILAVAGLLVPILFLLIL